jgi:hypothetical protein
MSSESFVEPKIHMPTSVRNLDLENSSEDESESLEGNKGFPFIDVEILTQIMETFWCPDCRCGPVTM